MKKQWFCTLLAVAMAGSGMAAEEISSPVRKLDVFKNGIGVVERSLEMPKTALDGVYRYLKVPTSIQGTFFISGAEKAQTSVLTEYLEEAAKPYSADYATLYSGKTVTVQLRDRNGDAASIITGVVMAPEKPPMPGEPVEYSHGMMMPRLLIKTSQGIAAVNVGDIASITGSGINATQSLWKSVLQINTPNPLKDARLHYLAKGIAWVPSYRIELTSRDRMNIAQTAVLRNELEDFTDVEVRLISGFPNILCQNVNSLMSPDMTLDMFFHQLNGSGGNAPVPMQKLMRNNMMAFAADMETGGGAAVPQLPPDGMDMFFQPVGKLSMKKGESRYLELAQAQTPYRRLLEWTIPTQQELERFGYNNPEREKALSDIWECVVFQNPFDFPLTTAPAALYSQADFSGQAELAWVNPKQEATLKTTKALSIKTEVTEVEDISKSKSRESVTYNNTTMQRVHFKGTIALTNYRDQAVEIRIKKQLFGQDVTGSDTPKVTVLPQNWRTANLLNQLEWTITLEPKAEKSLTFDYSMLL